MYIYIYTHGTCSLEVVEAVAARALKSFGCKLRFKPINSTEASFAAAARRA